MANGHVLTLWELLGQSLAALDEPAPECVYESEQGNAEDASEQISAGAAGRWWVALSGGRDSMVLLDLLHRWTQSRRRPESHAQSVPELNAIHVHHGLHPSADTWAELCGQQCAKRGIPLTIRHVAVNGTAGRGLEAAARDARYAEFRSVLLPGDTLMLAHHADDQAETVLYRLLRGAGPRGLSGMPVERPLGVGRLYRPLLDARRELINAWAHANNLAYVEDPSNSDTRLDRNYLRQRVLPLLEERWPGCQQAITRAAGLQGRAVAQWSQLPLPVEYSVFGEPALSLTPMPHLTPRADGLVDDAQIKSLGDVLYRWLTLEGILAPSLARLLEFANQLLTAAEDRNPELRFGDVVLRRWRGKVYRCCTDRDLCAPLPATVVAGTDLVGPWGSIIWTEADPRDGVPLGAACALRSREEGERIAPLNGARRPFGQLCQERDIPPWWRDVVPLILSPQTGKPMIAPGLGNLSGLQQDGQEAGQDIEQPGAQASEQLGTQTRRQNIEENAETARVKPVWVPPLGDSSIEQEGPC